MRRPQQPAGQQSNCHSLPRLRRLPGAGSLSASGQPKPRMGNITLKMLLDEGLVLSGDNNLVSEYKGVTQLASLRPDGRIACLVGACRDLSCDTVYQRNQALGWMGLTCGQLLPWRKNVEAAS